MQDVGRKKYTFKPLPISYSAPHLGVNSHPALYKAKDTADRLHQTYEEVTAKHQAIHSKLLWFKRLLEQPESADLTACFLAIERLAGRGVYIFVRYNESTQEPVELVCKAKEVAEAVVCFNEVLALCHEFLREKDGHLAEIRRGIEALKKLTVTMQVREIWTRFEAEAPRNIELYVREIKSFFLDTFNAEKQICGGNIYRENGHDIDLKPKHESEL